MMLEHYSLAHPGEQRETVSENSARTKRKHPPFPATVASHRLSRRFGLTPATAAALASIAGIGPQEVRQ